MARNLLRQELVSKASSGDTEGVKDMLTMIAEEAYGFGNRQNKKNESIKIRPRASAEVRNDSGQSLLSIAAQNDDEELAKFLLTYWKTLNDSFDLLDGEVSDYARVFKANVNSRDLKGWSCVCIGNIYNIYLYIDYEI